MYIARAYEKWVDKNNFKDKLYKGNFPKDLPVPAFVVLYNGKQDIDFSKEYSLKELFVKNAPPISLGSLDLRVKYIDIRYNNVKSMYHSCESLMEYSEFVDLYGKMPFKDLMKKFKEKNILGEILEKEGVENMVNLEFSAREIADSLIAQGEVKGEVKGRVEILYNELNLSDNQIARKLDKPIEVIQEVLGLLKREGKIK